MTVLTQEKEPVVFSPGLYADDELANYWMRQVTIRLRREICWCWYERGALPDSHHASLPPFGDKASSALDMSRFREEKIMFCQTDPTAKYLTGQLEAAPPMGKQAVRGSFGWVVRELCLDSISSFVLALGLVAAFDSTAGSVVSACLNDPLKTYPNLALAQKLWDRPEQVLTMADPAHPLFRYGLLQLGGRTAYSYSEIDWESPVTAPSLVADQLLFPGSSLPPALALIALKNCGNPVTLDTSYPVASRLRSDAADILRMVPVRGLKGSDFAEIIYKMARMTDRDVIEFKGDPGLLENSRYLNSLVTLCWLRGMGLFLSKDTVPALNRGKHDSNTVFLLQSIPVTIFLGITEKSQLAGIPASLLLPAVDIPGLSYHERVDYWKKMLGTEATELGGIISECSRRFRYEKKTIDDICEGLRGLSRQILEKDLIEACRAEFEADINELAQRVTPRFEDEELILPHFQHLQFQEIIRAMKALTEVHYGWGTGKAWNESGISVLFTGPPGTGKTMAAEILAIKLDLPMYRIDLSQVVNKYIGETEKNLKRLFDAADVSDVILFFDEADSLFGRRTEVKDAHDRYANLEISYLLERMERFKGLAILSTNRKKDLDEAFQRRLRYIIDFPLPGEKQRENIWRQVIPKNVDSSKLDFGYLAKQFPLAGGHIRSIVFNACLQRANDPGSLLNGKGQLEMEDIVIAVKREFDKMNRSVSLEQFGPYHKIIQRLGT